MTRDDGNHAPPADATDVIVVGAGAAGMLAAIAAGQCGARVVMLEQLDRAGAKLLASGGGRCNLSNTLPAGEFMARFGREGRFLSAALEALGCEKLRAMLAGLDVPTHVAGSGQVYPASNRAATVQTALRRRCEQLGATLRTGARVEALCIEAGRVTGVRVGGAALAARTVVLATGGRSYARLGGTGGGYALARQAGHVLVAPTPALVPLVTAERWCRKLAGVSAPARVRVGLPGQSRRGELGDVLFTHRGVSGPAVLDLSGEVAELLADCAEVPILFDFAPDAPRGESLRRMDDWRRRAGRRHVRALLAERLPAALAAALCDHAGVAAETLAAHLTGEQARALAGELHACRLTVTGTEGWAAAMVTRGGVALRQVDPRSLASRLVEGLHFAGELLDLDGPCGGFNLQCAFATGFLAGLSAGAAVTAARRSG